ncbi:MAG: hypothetical protein ACKO7W_21795 [Elainella sp.]
MPKLFYNSHTVTLALIAAIMLLLEIAQPRQSRLLADDLAADRTTQTIDRAAQVTNRATDQLTDPTTDSAPVHLHQTLHQNWHL